jgi:hypothetical protein
MYSCISTQYSGSIGVAYSRLGRLMPGDAAAGAGAAAGAAPAPDAAARWLVEAAAWRPEDIPQQLLVECPALAALKVCLSTG